MNPKLAVKGINGIIEGGISVTDFAVVTELDEISAKELLYTLVQNGIGTWNDDLVDFDIPHDRFTPHYLQSLLVQQLKMFLNILLGETLRQSLE